MRAGVVSRGWRCGRTPGPPPWGILFWSNVLRLVSQGRVSRRCPYQHAHSLRRTQPAGPGRQQSAVTRRRHLRAWGGVTTRHLRNAWRGPDLLPRRSPRTAAVASPLAAEWGALAGGLGDNGWSGGAWGGQARSCDAWAWGREGVVSGAQTSRRCPPIIRGSSWAGGAAKRCVRLAAKAAPTTPAPPALCPLLAGAATPAQDRASPCCCPAATRQPRARCSPPGTPSLACNLRRAPLGTVMAPGGKSMGFFLFLAARTARRMHSYQGLHKHYSVRSAQPRNLASAQRSALLSGLGSAPSCPRNAGPA